MSEEEGKSSQNNSKKDSEHQDNDLLKFKSEIGIINKMKVTILVA
jgi:hypothetical protein